MRNLNNSIFTFIILILQLINLGCTAGGGVPGVISDRVSVDDTAVDLGPSILPPNSLVLVDPISTPGFSRRPVVRVGGLEVGHTVTTYSDANCSTVLGSSPVGGETADVASEIDIGGNGSYKIYADAKLGTNRSTCSIANVDYTVDSSLGPSVTGLVNDETPTKSKTWNWACDKSNCEYRFIVNTSPSHSFGGEVFSAVTTTTQNTGTGTYYLHVQVRDNDTTTLGYVQTYSAVIDNTAPIVAITTPSSDGQYFSNTINIGGSCNDEGVSVNIQVNGAINESAICSAGSWLKSNINISGVASNSSISITADMVDSSGNIATTATRNFAKDIVAPSNISGLNQSPTDGLFNRGNTGLWVAATDAISGLSHYELAVGTTSGATNIVAYKNIGLVTSYQIVSGVDFTGSLTPETNYFTSIRAVDNQGNVSGVVTSSAWTFSGPEVINNLSVATTLKNSADIAWTQTNTTESSVLDYIVEYKKSSDGAYTVFNDGANTNTSVTITGLDPDTSYEFRVKFIFSGGFESNYSNIATAETKPDDVLFDNEFKAMNVGGAETSVVSALEDGTNVKLNGVDLVTLNRGEVHSFASSQFDVIEANKAIFTAGKRGSGGDRATANIVWNPVSWAGKAFSFNAVRNNPQQLKVYAVQDTVVTAKQGTTTLDTEVITAGNSAVLSWNAYGSYQVTSTGIILAYHISDDDGSNKVDPKPLLPSSKDILGFPSSSMRLTVNNDTTTYNAFHSNGSTTSGTINKNTVRTISPQGTSSLYRSESLRIKADKKISGASFADSNGLCAAPFLPTNLMKKKYIINVSADYVAFASLNPGTIQVLDSSDVVIDTLTLTRTGSGNAPYKARRATTSAGIRFISTVPMAGWYQPNTNTGAADNDESILYGSD